VHTWRTRILFVWAETQNKIIFTLAWHSRRLQPLCYYDSSLLLACACPYPWVSEGLFPGEPIAGFSRCSQKILSGVGPKVLKFLFFSLEMKKTTFFAKNVIGECQIWKSSGAKAPSDPLPTTLSVPMVGNDLMRKTLRQSGTLASWAISWVNRLSAALMNCCIWEACLYLLLSRQARHNWHGEVGCAQEVSPKKCTALCLGS